MEELVTASLSAWEQLLPTGQMLTMPLRNSTKLPRLAGSLNSDMYLTKARDLLTQGL